MLNHNSERSALETNATNLGREIIITHMELYHRRGRGGGRGIRKRRKRRRRIFKIPLNNNLKVKVVRSEGSLERCILFTKIK